jgi:hypothetical protein
LGVIGSPRVATLADTQSASAPRLIWRLHVKAWRRSLARPCQIRTAVSVTCKHHTTSAIPSWLLQQTCPINNQEASMPVLPNPRHEAFAQALARGKNATAAHEEASCQAVAHRWRMD